MHSLRRFLAKTLGPVRWRWRQRLEWWRVLAAGPKHPLWNRYVYRWSLSGMQADETDDARIKIGKYTYGVRSGSVLIATDDDRLEIGSYCSIAEGVRLICGEHPLSTVSTYPFRTIMCAPERNLDATRKGPLIVGSDVWIGTNAVVLSGVTIGHGAVVAAGAVVTKDVPPYAVVAGVPARVVKLRFRPEQVERLLKIAWWDWPEQRVRENMELFYGDVDEFIAAHEANAFPAHTEEDLE